MGTHGIVGSVVLIFKVSYIMGKGPHREKIRTCCSGCRVGYILNVTREIDNFFPGMFSYLNVRVYDEEATDLLAHWNDTYNFIVKAK